MPVSAATSRRAPQQARARGTAAAIVDALAAELEGRPFEEVTTQRLAARAQVNIGSLYQYFNGKEAILTALGERAVATYEATMLDAFARAHGHALRDGVVILLDAHAAALARYAATHTVLLPLLTSGEITGAYAETRARLIARLTAYLEARRPEVGPADLPNAARTCVECVEAVSFAALARVGGALAGDASMTELHRLARRYLLAEP